MFVLESVSQRLLLSLIFCLHSPFRVKYSSEVQCMFLNRHPQTSFEPYFAYQYTTLHLSSVFIGNRRPRDFFWASYFDYILHFESNIQVRFSVCFGIGIPETSFEPCLLLTNMPLSISRRILKWSSVWVGNCVRRSYPKIQNNSFDPVLPFECLEIESLPCAGRSPLRISLSLHRKSCLYSEGSQLTLQITDSCIRKKLLCGLNFLSQSS